MMAGLLLLTACSGGEGQRAAPEEAGSKVLCATGGAGELKPACTMEEVSGTEGPALIIRNPEGGFRKLLVTTDGRGVIAADGAQPATVRLTGEHEIEVAVGGDRYRLPATIKDRMFQP